MAMYYITVPWNIPSKTHIMHLKGQNEDPKQQPAPNLKESRDEQTESKLLELYIVGLYILLPRLQEVTHTGIINGTDVKCKITICAVCLFWKPLPEGLDNIY